MASLARALASSSVPARVVVRRSYAAAASATASARIVQRDYIAERRRAEQKRLLKPAEDPNAPLLKFPDERLGRHYEVNYALAPYGISPLGESAYRNLHARHLQMLSAAKKDAKSGALVLAAQDGAVPVDSYVAEAFAEATLGVGSWRKLMAAVTRNLSESDALFVRDAAAGASKSAQVTVRAVTSSPEADAVLESALFRAPGSVDRFAHDVVLLHAPTLKLADAQRYGVKRGEAGQVVHMLMRGDDVLATLSPQERAAIPAAELAALQTRATVVTLVAGTRSSAALRRALDTAVRYVQRTRADRLVLPGAALVPAGSGVLAVVDAASALPRSVSALSRGGAVLGAEGVSALYADAVYSAQQSAAQSGDRVELEGAAVARVTERLPSALSAYAKALAGVVVVVRDTTGALPPLSRLSAASAAALLELSGASDVALSTASVSASQRALLQARLGSVPAYAVNAALLDGAEVARAVAAVAAGEAQSATLSAVKELDLGAIGKLKGLEEKRLAYAKNAAAIAAYAKLLQ